MNREKLTDWTTRLVLLLCAVILLWRLIEPVRQRWTARRAASEQADRAARHADATMSGLAVVAPATYGDSVAIFTDYECPYCGRLEQSLRAASPKDFPIKIIYHHLPITTIHAWAMDGAVLAECAARNGQFRAVHDALFQSTLWKTPDMRSQWLTEARIDTATSLRILTCARDDADARSTVQQDLALADSIGIAQTPTLVYGRHVVPGIGGPAAIMDSLRAWKK